MNERELRVLVEFIRALAYMVLYSVTRVSLTTDHDVMQAYKLALDEFERNFPEV